MGAHQTHGSTPTASRYRVLLVDDDPELRRTLGRLIEANGWEVHEAGSREEALARLASLRPELVLLDVVLPDGDGLAVCEEIRRDPRHEETIVMVITGVPDRETRSRCFKSGADDLLIKPLDPDEIKMHLRNVAKCRAKADEIRRIKDELERRVEERTQELQQANVRLMHVHRMEAIAVLAGGIAHDFNNILSPILGYADLLLEDHPDGDTAENAMYIRTAALRARDLVQQILTFSRQREGSRTRVKMQVIAAEVARLLDATLPAQIGLATYFDKRCRDVEADPVQVHQLVTNLCTNAYQAMAHTGGTLGVRVEDAPGDPPGKPDEPDARPGPHVLLTVSDTGHGIRPEHLDRIFEPYFTTREHGAGSGLGLAVVHGIVAGCGGRIDVQSQVGVGTTVRVWLPAMSDAASTERDQAARTVDSRQLRILLVDDEPLLRRVFNTILTRLGHQPVVFEDPREALEAFNAAPDTFDLVITDYMMHGLTGADLGRKIRETSPSIPMILCTGFSDSTSEADARPIGFSVFLKKPFTKQNLFYAIEEAMSSVQR